jgi:hypothetical protein
MSPEWVAAVAGMITSFGVIGTLAVSMRNSRKISQVHSEVKTTNGLTLAALADRTEGRRINADIPAADRTSAETHYVENLDKEDP